MMKLLNLGCGDHYNNEWINIDFYSNSDYVISHNLLNGIPFPDNEIDVVYHSHILEHFSKTDGLKFLEECYRVLKQHGIIRIAVPDLESIVKEYLKNLDRVIKKDNNAEKDYDWILLELFDQVSRNKSGGEMGGLLSSENIENKEYIFSRIGVFGETIHKELIQTESEKKQANFSDKFKTIISPSTYFNKIKSYICNKDLKYTEIGKFRLSGEIHQYMYDRFSLTRALQQTKFRNVNVVSAFESSISNWSSYNLDVIDGKVYKPDSLFIEAVK
jgi:SAM-dependent methyltransferase